MSPTLTIAVSSRALFDFEEENEIYKDKGEDAYIKIQQQRLNEIASPGVAFSLIQKILSFNEDEELVKVVVMSRNDPVTGLRVFRSIAENKLKIEQGCFTRGAASFSYLSAFGAQLFLSAFAEDVKSALATGVPAAHIVGGRSHEISDDNILRIAFDGDAVLFDDESEKVYQTQGFEAFREQEKNMKDKPLQPGPLKPFLDALAQLRHKLKNKSGRIRTALITARGAPAHERPIRTLMDWGVPIDEAFFMNGQDKQEIVKKFKADFFFDDNVRHVDGLQQGGHVPSGIINE